MVHPRSLVRQWNLAESDEGYANPACYKSGHQFAGIGPPARHGIGSDQDVHRTSGWRNAAGGATFRTCTILIQYGRRGSEFRYEAVRDHQYLSLSPQFRELSPQNWNFNASCIKRGGCAARIWLKVGELMSLSGSRKLV